MICNHCGEYLSPDGECAGVCIELDALDDEGYEEVTE